MASAEDKAVSKILAALSDRLVSPRHLGIILRHRRVYSDSAAERNMIDEFITGLTHE